MIRSALLACWPSTERWYLLRADLGWLVLAAMFRRSESPTAQVILSRAISSHFDASFDEMNALTSSSD